LVALLVLTVGLLGLAGLQSFGLRFSHESYERTQANVLMYDVLDRMRANPAVALDANAANAYDGQIDSTGTYSAPSQSCLVGSSCTGVQLRDYDRYRWFQMIAGDTSTTPPIRGLFSKDNNTQLTIALNRATGIFTVTVSWQEKDLTMNSSVQTRLF